MKFSAVAVIVLPCAVSAFAAFSTKPTFTCLSAERISGGPDSTKAPSKEVDMEWTMEALREIIRDNGELVSVDDPHLEDPEFYDDWRNDPERADLITEADWDAPGLAKDLREKAIAEAAKIEATTATESELDATTTAASAEDDQNKD